MTTTPTTTLYRTGAVGTVAVDCDFATDQDDLWEALTLPERLARWLANVKGEARLGGTVQLVFTSGWEGTGVVTECEPPRRLVVDTTDSEGQTGRMTAVLTATGEGTHLRIEDTGMPAETVRPYGGGLQLHVEDLVTALAGGTPGGWKERWEELAPQIDRLQISEPA